MLADMEKAEKIYQPTQFWENASKKILSELTTDDDFTNFRNLPFCKSMFATTYQHYYYRKNKKIIDTVLKLPFSRNLFSSIKDYLTGFEQAKQDYRLYLATSSKGDPDLGSVSESEIGNPEEYFVFDGKRYNNGFLNYLRGINFLKNCVDASFVTSIMEIGGGFGTLGEIYLKTSPQLFYLNIDIPPVAAVSSYYLSMLFGKDQVFTYDLSREMDCIDIEEISSKYRCAVICPWQLEKVIGRFDLFVNFISFQEMEPKVVKNYVSILQNNIDKYVMIRNSKYGKKIAKNERDIGVVDRVKIDFIIDLFDQFKVIDRDYKVYGGYSKTKASEIVVLKHQNLL